MTHREPITIIILGGNPLIGQALEILLRSVGGYEVQLRREPEAFRVEDLLEGVDVLLLGPSLSNGRRKDFLSAMTSTLKTAIVPVLSLSPSSRVTLAEDRLVPWPCKR